MKLKTLMTTRKKMTTKMMNILVFAFSSVCDDSATHCHKIPRTWKRNKRIFPTWRTLLRLARCSKRISYGSYSSRNCWWKSTKSEYKIALGLFFAFLQLLRLSLCASACLDFPFNKKQTNKQTNTEFKFIISLKSKQYRALRSSCRRASAAKSQRLLSLWPESIVYPARTLF